MTDVTVRTMGADVKPCAVKSCVSDADAQLDIGYFTIWVCETHAADLRDRLEDFLG
jgi:hypothetical protein